jgi:hypothetical protein
MATMTNIMEDKILNLLRGQNITGFSDVYVGLFTSETSDDGTGVEVVGGGYERVKVTFTEPIQNNGIGEIVNDTSVDFTPATADWGLITNIALFDKKVDGTMLYQNSLVNSKNIETDDSVRFPIGQIVVTQS